MCVIDLYEDKFPHSYSNIPVFKVDSYFLPKCCRQGLLQAGWIPERQPYSSAVGIFQPLSMPHEVLLAFTLLQHGSTRVKLLSSTLFFESTEKPCTRWKSFTVFLSIYFLHEKNEISFFCLLFALSSKVNG